MAAVANVGILAETELTGAPPQSRRGTGSLWHFRYRFPHAGLANASCSSPSPTEQWRAADSETHVGLGARMEALATAFEADLDARRSVTASAPPRRPCSPNGPQRGVISTEITRPVFPAPPRHLLEPVLRDVAQMGAQDWRASEKKPLFKRLAHPGCRTSADAGQPAALFSNPRTRPPAPAGAVACER